jgi:hypothetical protein
MPPLPGPLLHKSVEEREKSNMRKNRDAPGFQNDALKA